jgi:predicted AAA+ superfamily ATPase
LSPSDALDFNDLKRISSEAAIEGFVAAEILKSQVDRGECRELYFFRDQQGLEVDFLIPRPNAGLWPVEAKASKTVTPAMAASLLSLQRALGARAKRLIVAHRKFNSSVQTVAVARGVEALDISQLVADLSRG